MDVPKPTDQEAQIVPESLANHRFIALFKHIINVRAVVADSERSEGRVIAAILPRTLGWTPDKTKFEDIENALNRIFVTETSGYSAERFNMQEVRVSDLDEEDDGTYWTKRFNVVGDRVSVDVDHMRVNPAIDEAQRISSEHIEQAPAELLNKFAAELEKILAQPLET